MNYCDLKIIFCISKQYAIYKNKDQAAEKQNIGNHKHM